MSDVYDDLANVLSLPDRDRLEPATQAALSALGAAIRSSQVRQRLAEAIDPALASSLRAGAGQPATSVEALSTRVAELVEVQPGVGFEIVQVFTGWLAARLPDEVIEAVRGEVADDWSSLLTAPPARPASLPIDPATTARRRTLAEAAPGSTRPLSTAKPTAGQAGSVARTDDPRAGRKLSSAEGPDPDGEGRSLADAEPGAGGRSLSRGRE